MNFSKIITIVLLAIVMTNCGKDESGDAGSNAETVFSGIWKSTCTQPSITTMDISGSRMASSAVSYGDASCANALFSLVITSTLSVGADKTSPAGSKEVNITAVSLIGMAMDDATVAALNQAKYCEVSNWAKNEEIDLTTKNCSNSTYTVGATIYSIGKVENNTLVLGRTSGSNDGKTAATRHTELNTSVVLTKQ